MFRKSTLLTTGWVVLVPIWSIGVVLPSVLVPPGHSNIVTFVTWTIFLSGILVFGFWIVAEARNRDDQKG